MERMGLVNNVFRLLEDESTVFASTFKSVRSRFYLEHVGVDIGSQGRGCDEEGG